MVKKKFPKEIVIPKLEPKGWIKVCQEKEERNVPKRTCSISESLVVRESMVN